MGKPMRSGSCSSSCSDDSVCRRGVRFHRNSLAFKHGFYDGLNGLFIKLLGHGEDARSLALNRQSCIWFIIG